VEPERSWAEQLVLQLRVTGARLSGAVLGPAMDAIEHSVAPLASLQQEYARVSHLLAVEGPLAYCFCSVE
jgi:hypothetical protein